MKAVGRPQKWTKMWRSGRKSVGARYSITSIKYKVPTSVLTSRLEILRGSLTLIFEPTTYTNIKVLEILQGWHYVLSKISQKPPSDMLKILDLLNR